VIDSRAPRTNQAIVGTLSLIAFVTGWWPILGLLAAQLAIGLTFGRRYCLPCLLYFEVLQPRFGEGPIEDSRPPRFANIVGVIFLGAATLGHLAGSATIGWGLGLIVAALAPSRPRPDCAWAARCTRSRHAYAAFVPAASSASTSPSSARTVTTARPSSS